MRLNSPRGKFKRTNMANDQVDLTPEVDIPGAGFIEKEIEKLTIAQQKLWLKCLCINQNGNKKNCWKGRCTSPGFAQSISCFIRCLFSTTSSWHGGLDTCFHTKFAFSGSRTCKQWKSKNIWPWPREDLHYIKQS